MPTKFKGSTQPEYMHASLFVGAVLASEGPNPVKGDQVQAVDQRWVDGAAQYVSRTLAQEAGVWDFHFDEKSGIITLIGDQLFTEHLEEWLCGEDLESGAVPLQTSTGQTFWYKPVGRRCGKFWVSGPEGKMPDPLADFCVDVLWQACQHPKLQRAAGPLALHMAEHRMLGEGQPVTRDHCVAIVDICGAGGLYGLPKGLSGTMPQSFSRGPDHLLSMVGSSAIDLPIPVTHRGKTGSVVLRDTAGDADCLSPNPSSPSLLLLGGDAEVQPPNHFDPPLRNTVAIFELHLDSFAAHVKVGGYATSDRAVALDAFRTEVEDRTKVRPPVGNPSAEPSVVPKVRPPYDALMDEVCKRFDVRPPEEYLRPEEPAWVGVWGNPGGLGCAQTGPRPGMPQATIDLFVAALEDKLTGAKYGPSAQLIMRKFAVFGCTGLTVFPEGELVRGVRRLPKVWRGFNLDDPTDVMGRLIRDAAWNDSTTLTILHSNVDLQPHARNIEIDKRHRWGVPSPPFEGGQAGFQAFLRGLRERSAKQAAKSAPKSVPPMNDRRKGGRAEVVQHRPYFQRPEGRRPQPPTRRAPERRASGPEPRPSSEGPPNLCLGGCGSRPPGGVRQCRASSPDSKRAGIERLRVKDYKDVNRAQAQHKPRPKQGPRRDR
eukprot:gene540-268_t